MLSQTEILSVMENAVYTTLISALPMLIAALVIGVLISIFQATTQINEQTLAFVPKIIAILLTLLLSAGFIITTLTEFTTRMFGYVNTMIK